MVTACNKMFLHRVTYYIVFISSVILLVQAEKHLNTNGPFRKRHTVGNEPSPYACDRGAGIASPFFRRRTKAVKDIQISKTLYVSSEQIQLTWKPISASCKDDFIGIFYTEVPMEKGKYITYNFFISYNQYIFLYFSL
jgi:hypothetical protein